MKMTRSHFQALATAVADIIVDTNANRKNTESIIEHISQVCEDSNPRFKPEKFEEWIQDILIKES